MNTARTTTESLWTDLKVSHNLDDYQLLAVRQYTARGYVLVSAGTLRYIEQPMGVARVTTQDLSHGLDAIPDHTPVYWELQEMIQECEDQQLEDLDDGLYIDNGSYYIFRDPRDGSNVCYCAFNLKAL